MSANLIHYRSVLHAFIHLIIKQVAIDVLTIVILAELIVYLHHDVRFLLLKILLNL